MTVSEKGTSRFREDLQRLYPSTLPSAALVERIKELADATDALSAEKRSRPRYRRWVLACAAVAFVLGTIPIAVNLLSPRAVLADTLRKVVVNVGNLKGYHWRATRFHDAKVIGAQEVWSQGGRLRVDAVTNGVPFTQILADRKFWSYSPGKNAWLPQSSGAGTLIVSEEWFQNQMRQAQNNAKAASLGTVMRNGHRLEEIALPAGESVMPFATRVNGRTVCWIDLDRMLPVTIEQQVREGQQWTPLLRVEYDFDHPITPDIFTLSANAKGEVVLFQSLSISGVAKK